MGRERKIREKKNGINKTLTRMLHGDQRRGQPASLLTKSSIPRTAPTGAGCPACWGGPPGAGLPARLRERGQQVRPRPQDDNRPAHPSQELTRTLARCSS